MDNLNIPVNTTFENPTITPVVKKKKPWNTTGHNQKTNAIPDFPYSMRFAFAKALMDKGVTGEEIKSLTGLCNESLRRIKNGIIKVNDTVVEKLRTKEVDKLTWTLHQVLDSVSEEDMEKAGLSQKMVATGILIDKRALLEGKPTVRVEFSSQNDLELESKIKEKEAELDKWKSGEIVNAESEIESAKEDDNDGQSVAGNGNNDQ